MDIAHYINKFLLIIILNNIIMNKYEIYKVKDASESYYTKKDTIVDLPMRMAIIGASQRSGKSNLICNLLLRDEFYNKDFEGSNIYIVSPSLKTDNKLKKLIEVKDIPESNLFDDYDEHILEQLYKDLQEHYNDSVNENTKTLDENILEKYTDTEKEEALVLIMNHERFFLYNI
jgi:hypothetical protein